MCISSMELSSLIQSLQDCIFKELQLDIKHLPLEFYQDLQQELVIKAGFPTQAFQEISNKHLPHTPIHWQSQISPHLTQLPGYGIKNIHNAIAIVSGKGGVGKSTVSSNLACASALIGAQVGLLDADIYGPSIPTMMGITSKPLPVDDNQYQPIKNHSVECMSMGLLQEDGPLIWRGPMLAKALMQMINQTAWSALDYLFIDLPPGTGDIPLSLTQKIPLSGAIIVTSPQTIATLDAEKALQMLLRLNIPVLGIISNMAWHECENCHHQSTLFGDTGAKQLAEKYDVTLLGEVPLHHHIREQADIGHPIATQLNSPLSKIWQQIALNTLIALASRPINTSSKFPPIRTE